MFGAPFAISTSGIQVVPQPKRFGERLQLVECPFEEVAHRDGFAGQRVFDLGAQSVARGDLFVRAGAGNVFAVIAEGARELRVAVEADEQQVLQRQVGDVHLHRVAAVVGADLDASHGQVDARHQVLFLDLAGHLFEPVRPRRWNTARASTGRGAGRRWWK